MANRIALVTVQDELRRRRGAGGEIKQQRIVGARFTIGSELRRRMIPLFVRNPARRVGAKVIADHDPRIVSGQVCEFRRGVGAGDDMADAAARKAIGKIVAGQQRRGRHDDRAELHRR